MNEDEELARRSIRGFGEMVAALGRWGVGPEAEVRRANALGARIAMAAENPWFDGAVVPPNVPPPDDDPELPGCLWSVAHAVPGRVAEPAIATPCLGLFLNDPAVVLESEETVVESPSLAIIGDVNERAYGQFGIFGPLVQSLRDERVCTHGLREGPEFACVALTIDVEDDLSIHYVATEAEYRRRGLATRLLRAMLAQARQRGLRSASLQASADGLPVWERLGFRRVATLNGFLRHRRSRG